MKRSERPTLNECVRKAIRESHGRQYGVRHAVQQLIVYTDHAHPGFSALLERLVKEAHDREKAGETSP